MDRSNLQKEISVLKKDIQQKQAELDRLETVRKAELTAVSEKENAEDLLEFQQTKHVPQRLKQAIKEAFGVRIYTTKIEGDMVTGFRQGDYEYLVLARGSSFG